MDARELITRSQLAALDHLARLFSANGLDYWLFGGWAVDAHLGVVTRAHGDIDLAVWSGDHDRIETLLFEDGWAHAPEEDEDGFTGYTRGKVRLELAFLARDRFGTIYTPLQDGRGEWPEGAFGDEIGAVEGVRMRVIALEALRTDKSQPQTDEKAAAKDRADVASLSQLG